MSNPTERAVNIGSASSARLTFQRLMATNYGPAIVMVLVIIVTDIAWNTYAGLTFVGWSHPVVASAFMLLVSFFYATMRPSPPIAELALYGALWITFTTFGAIQTYLGASAARPLIDGALVHFDSSIGFDWMAWVGFVRFHPMLNTVLRAAYNSLLLQIVGSLLLFSLAKVNGRNQELLLNAAVALFLTTLLAAALPALGPWVHFGYGALNSADTAYVAHVLALRQGNPPPFALSQMQGIDCFPSFHTVLAVLLVYAHRGIRWSFLPVTTLNAVMLFSIPSEGGHYLSDMIGGAAVALLAITLVHAALRLTLPARMLHPPRSVPV